MNLELFREKVRYYRPLTERTQEDLAKALGLSPYVLSHKLHGTRNARLTHREVQAIVKTLVEWGAMTRQAEARELLELMDCPDFLPDEWNAPPFKWLQATTSTPSVPPSNTASPNVEPAVPVQRSGATRPLAHQSSQEAIASPPLRRDWGEAIDVSAFYGRESELVELERWIVDEHCRLVALLSRGGYGKTALSVKLTQQIARHFDVVIWRSLQNTPPLERLLADYLTFLSEQHTTDLPESTGERMTLLFEYLRTARCLLALDNVETLFQARNRAGAYRAGYEAYGQFFQRVGQTAHRSCLLLTSREQPKELAPLEGDHAPVRTMTLAGLEQGACRQILKDSNLAGTEVEYRSLADRCAGNPLALKVVAATIRELFGGNITEFLSQGTVLFGDIRGLLDQQFEHLSASEEAILFWLALVREPLALGDLVQESLSPLPGKELLEALGALRRRSLLERGEAGAVFTLHPVVMEYVAERLVEQVAQEITTGHLELLLSHGLMQAQTKAYVRHAQAELILKPVLARLLMLLKSEQGIEQRLRQVLATVRNRSWEEQGYGGGNVINLLAQLRGTLRGYDCSHLRIRQAYLAGVELQEANFVASRFEQSVFSEPFSSMYCVAFSPDGQYLAAGSMNGEVGVWQVARWKQIMTLSGHLGWVWSVAFHPDGTRLASGGEDRLVRVWEVSTGQCLKTLQGHTDWVRSVAFSPDGARLASSSNDGTVKLWEVSTGQCLTTLQGHTGRVWSVAFSPDGARLASSSEDGTVRLWEVSTGQCLATLQGHTGRVWSVAFSAASATLASGSNDRMVKLWEVNTGQCLATLQGHTDWIRSVAFSPDGTLLASGSHDRTVRVWEVSTGQCLTTLQGHTGRVWAVAFSPDGARLATSSDDGTVRLWEVSTGQCLATLQGHAIWSTSVSFSPDRSRFAAGSHDGTVKLWEVSTGKCLQMLRGHTRWVGSVAFSPDGTLLASGSHDRTVQVWEVSTGQCLTTLQGHTDWVRSVTFSPDGARMASGSYDTTVRIWEVSTGKCLQTLRGHTNWVGSVGFSLDGTLLASGSHDRTVRVWDVSSGACLQTLQGHTDLVRSGAFSDVSTGKCLQILQGHTGWVESVTFSPDGATLASGGHDGTVRVWDVSSGACLNTLHSHPGRIWAVVFSPDGRMVMSASEDRTILCWNVRTGECVNRVRNRLYEGMNITGITGLTEAQKATLRALGAVDFESRTSQVEGQRDGCPLS